MINERFYNLIHFNTIEIINITRDIIPKTSIDSVPVTLWTDIKFKSRIHNVSQSNTIKLKIIFILISKI